MVDHVVPIRVYESNSVPQSAATPFRRNADSGSGIGAALSRAGQAVENYQENDLRIQAAQANADEDAGRIQAAQRMADFRTQALAMRRSVFESAPNGYENATQTAAANYGQLQQQFLSDGLASPQANRFFSEASNLWHPEFLDSVAGEEAQARDQYQADTISNTAEANANILIGDPSQYDHIYTEMTASLGGIQNQNLRRDAEHRINTGLASATISGLIDRNPGATLRRLQATEPDPLVSRLSASERDQAIRSAHAEIQRRQAQAQVATAQAASTAQARWAVGLDAPNAPSFDAVYSTLGPAAALQFETSRLTGQHTSDLSGMTSAQLAGIASQANDPAAAARGHDLSVGGNRHTGQGDDELRSAINGQARAQAAANILQERLQDPMQQQVRQGLVPQSDIVGAVRQGDWGMVNGILANRAAAAEQNGATLGMPALPLTAFEARAIGPVIRAMPAQERAVALRNFAAWTGGGDAYRNMMGQLFPTSPGTAYAGYISGIRGTHGATNGEIIMRGEDLLGGRNPSATGADATTQRSTPLVSLPSEDKLREAWRRSVGDAYSGFGVNTHADSQAEEQTYQIFRQAYAALSYDAHDPAPQNVDTTRVANAVRVSTGGITSWGGHNTIVPPGMTASQFSNGVREGFSRWDQLRGQDPRSYALRPLGLTANGGGRYVVYHGDDPVMSPAGRPVEIEVRR